MPDKSTFIQKSIDIHSEKNRTFNYEEVPDFVKANSNVTLVCNIHNYTFTQTAVKHLQGQTGCKFCSRRGLTQDDVISLFVDKWGDRWDYSKTVFKTMNSKLTITCKEHGDFEQTPSYHLDGIVSCGKCNGQERITRESFIERAIEIHGPSHFDFSEVGEIKGAHTIVTVRCVTHNTKKDISAWQILRGNSACGLCLKFSKLTQEKVIHKAKIAGLREVILDKVDFAAKDFAGTKKVHIGCSEPGHGYFEQTINGYLSGRIGCPICDKENRLTSLDQFLEKSIKVWGPDHYDYSHVALKHGLQGDVALVCKIHPERGIVYYPFFNHLQGNEACEACRGNIISKPEIELREFIESLGFEVISNTRKILGRKEVDIFIPNKNVAIEFNGLYYHSEKFVEKDYHFEKTNLATEKGVRLLHVWEDDWVLRNDIVKNHIKSVLGVSDSKRVYARNLDIKVISKAMSTPFLNRYHIQGFKGASVHLGLFNNKELVAVMTFIDRGNGEWLLSRYATSCQVVGGHSKLLKFFEKSYEWGTIVTFADLAYSYGDLYRTTGWTEDSLSSPNFWYYRQGERHHRLGYRKSRFETDPSLKFEEGLTEHELALLNGLYRVYDAGKIRFVRRNTTKE